MKESSLIYQDYIQKPQFRFKNKIDNSENPWKSNIQSKPNALEPLDLYLEKREDGAAAYCHPYEPELEKFKTPEDQLEKVPITDCKSMSEIALKLVESVEQLLSMLDDLKDQKEIAIALKDHSERSFQGFTCLLLISTRYTDYIIDALKLRSELEVLNEVLTEPTILKVLYNADSDIVKLQRDFSLYIVNMFDITTAGEVCLKFTYLSYLLKKFCNVDLKNAHLSTDWRLRPLAKYLIDNARESVHYLLSLKDALVNELVDRKELEMVYEKSWKLCKKTYEKPKWSKESHLILYKRLSDKQFDAEQLFTLNVLNCMRFELARFFDESQGYILPDEIMLRIAETIAIENAEVYDFRTHFFSIDLVKWYIEQVNGIMAREKENRKTIGGKVYEDLPLTFTDFLDSPAVPKKFGIVKIFWIAIVVCFSTFYSLWSINKI